MISPFVDVATCVSMPQFRHESVYSVRILSLLMLSAMPGMLGRNAAASIDLNSCKESLFDTVQLMLVTLAACLIGLMLSCSKRFVQVPRLPWGAEAPEQAKGMQLTIQSQVSNEYKTCERQVVRLRWKCTGTPTAVNKHDYLTEYKVRDRRGDCFC